MVSSAAELVFFPGVFMTRIPFSVACSTSIFAMPTARPGDHFQRSPPIDHLACDRCL